MVIRVANPEEYNLVMQFYYNMIDDMKELEFAPGWEKDVYPEKNFIYNSMIQKELFVAIVEETIVSVMVLNHEHAAGYEKVKWQIEAGKREIIIIHALGISMKHQRQGIGKKMISYAIDLCRQKGIKAIRLDVLASNKPAKELYPSAGFDYIETIQLYYEDTGLTDFLLYELVL